MDDRCDLLEGWIWSMLSAARRDVGDDAVPPGSDGKDRQHTLARPIDSDLGVGERVTFHVGVRQDPIATQRLAGEGRIQRMADNAMRAIASAKPIRVNLFLL